MKVLIAAIGPHMARHGTEMALNTARACTDGAYLKVISDEGLNESIMRTLFVSALELARSDSDCDHLVMVHNDVMLAEDTIARLLKHHADITVPRFRYPSFPKAEEFCSWPPASQLDDGLQSIEWAAHSMILWSQRAFMHPEATFRVGCEPDDYRSWQRLGLITAMRVDVDVDVVELPHGFSTTAPTVAKGAGVKMDWSR